LNHACIGLAGADGGQEKPSLGLAVVAGKLARRKIGDTR